uniref:Uncharacterized protein n=1 Tax=Rhodnius prolixus TaxID=13249 RepID=T1IAW7_RHOPR
MIHSNLIKPIVNLLKVFGNFVSNDKLYGVIIAKKVVFKKEERGSGGGGGGGGGLTGQIVTSSSLLSPQDSITSQVFSTIRPSSKDQFLDLKEVLLDPGHQEVVINTYESDEPNPTIATIFKIKPKKNLTLLERFHLGISKHELYKENDPLVPAILQEMATAKIVHVCQKEGGTQIKLVIDYANKDQALFKPMSKQEPWDPLEIGEQSLHPMLARNCTQLPYLQPSTAVISSSSGLNRELC